MSRRFSCRQRHILALLACGRCCNCNEPLTASFHADHRHPYSRGGATILRNGEALCAPCNLLKADKVITTRYTNGLRDWQKESLQKALDWYDNSGDRHFVINAAPGAGKTRAAIVIAAELLGRGLIERVVVIAPRSGVVDQWGKAFTQITGRQIARLTGKDDSSQAFSQHLCATWTAVSGLADAFQAICRAQPTLVICDEQHHAAIEAAWGRSADSAFADARYVLILTGTPTRSDGADSLWMPRDAMGMIRHPAGGTYTLTYGEAVDLGYCRPATFHRHVALFKVVLGDGTMFDVSNDDQQTILHDHPAIAAQQKSLDFYRLAKLPEFEADGVTPLLTGYHATMIEEASLKLDDLRCQMPTAGGLVIAPSIEVAEHFARLIVLIEKQPAMIVHSGVPNADRKIAIYRNDGTIRWLVSVGMVNEGIDIPRLRVLVFLPNGQTELLFRQALGRVVRSNGPEDQTRAYVVMPAWRIFEEYARRVEADMPPGSGHEAVKSAVRCCPNCKASNPREALECSNCADPLPPSRTQTFRTCPVCRALNPARASHCHTCGEPHLETHVVTLAHAARDGVISRGVEIDEAEVVLAEAGAADFQKRLQRSGNLILQGHLGKIPLELIPALVKIIRDF